VRHYLLTRSAYGPDVPIEVNRYRLELTRGITSRSLASQTYQDVTWLVLTDPADPLKEERERVLWESGLPFLTADAGSIERTNRYDRPQGPWHAHLDFSDATLTTRIDDDDAFAPWALSAFRDHAERYLGMRRRRNRRIFTLPIGYRVSSGKANLRRDRVNQFTTMYAPRGDRCCIMDRNHTGQNRLAHLIDISHAPGWLWLRHDGARSAESRASNRDKHLMEPISEAVRDCFDVDWGLIASLP
jgi:hypothetical protein